MQGGLFLEMPFSLFSMAPCCLLGLFRENTGGVPTSLEPLVEQEGVDNGPRPVHPLEGVPHEWAEG